MKNFNAQNFTKAMRCICDNYGNSIMKRTVAVRKIKTFPKNSNQARYAYICYDEYSNQLMAVESICMSIAELHRILPKRIACIEDMSYIPLKEFNEYIKYAIYTTAEKDNIIWNFAK